MRKILFIVLILQDDQGRHEVGFVENTIKTPIGDDGCLFEAKFLINKVDDKKFSFITIMQTKTEEMYRLNILGSILPKL